MHGVVQGVKKMKNKHFYKKSAICMALILALTGCDEDTKIVEVGGSSNENPLDSLVLRIGEPVQLLITPKASSLDGFVDKSLTDGKWITSLGTTLEFDMFLVDADGKQQAVTDVLDIYAKNKLVEEVREGEFYTESIGLTAVQAKYKDIQGEFSYSTENAMITDMTLDIITDVPFNAPASVRANVVLSNGTKSDLSLADVRLSVENLSNNNIDIHTNGFIDTKIVGTTTFDVVASALIDGEYKEVLRKSGTFTSLNITDLNVVSAFPGADKDKVYLPVGYSDTVEVNGILSDGSTDVLTDVSFSHAGNSADFVDIGSDGRTLTVKSNSGIDEVFFLSLSVNEGFKQKYVEVITSNAVPEKVEFVNSSDETSNSNYSVLADQPVPFKVKTTFTDGSISYNTDNVVFTHDTGLTYDSTNSEFVVDASLPLQSSVHSHVSLNDGEFVDNITLFTLDRVASLDVKIVRGGEKKSVSDTSFAATQFPVNSTYEIVAAYIMPDGSSILADPSNIVFAVDEPTRVDIINNEIVTKDKGDFTITGTLSLPGIDDITVSLFGDGVKLSNMAYANVDNADVDKTAYLSVTNLSDDQKKLELRGDIEDGATGVLLNAFVDKWEVTPVAGTPAKANSVKSIIDGVVTFEGSGSYELEAESKYLVSAYIGNDKIETEVNIVNDAQALSNFVYIKDWNDYADLKAACETYGDNAKLADPIDIYQLMNIVGSDVMEFDTTAANWSASFVVDDPIKRYKSVGLNVAKHYDFKHFGAVNGYLMMVNEDFLYDGVYPVGTNRLYLDIAMNDSSVKTRSYGISSGYGLAWNNALCKLNSSVFGSK